MYLLIINGFEEGRLIGLSNEINQIGRSEQGEKNGHKNTIVLAHDNRISKVHARIIRKNDGLFLEDMKSTHGTFLNNSKVVYPAHISAGDVIHLGATLFMVCNDKDNVPQMKMALSKAV